MRTEFHRYVATLIGVLVLSACDYTKKIESGSYGPFKIGSSKEETLAELEKMVPLSYLSPAVDNKVKVSAVSISELQKFNEDNGILIWLNASSSPLRVELEGDKVVKLWGFQEDCSQIVHENTRCNCDRNIELANKLTIGMPRGEVYGLFNEFTSSDSKVVSNFVPSYHEFRWSKNLDREKYRSFLMSKSTWVFEGLRNLSWYDEPWVSRVTLRFQDSKLTKIEHFVTPYETL